MSIGPAGNGINQKSNPSQDGWDWPYILYIGRVWLRYTDEQVWRLTPRQFDAQLKVHQKIQEAKYGTAKEDPAKPTGFIDQIPGW